MFHDVFSRSTATQHLHVTDMRKDGSAQYHERSFRGSEIEQL